MEVIVSWYETEQKHPNILKYWNHESHFQMSSVNISKRKRKKKSPVSHSNRSVTNVSILDDWKDKFILWRVFFYRLRIVFTGRKIATVNIYSAVKIAERSL